MAGLAAAPIPARGLAPGPLRFEHLSTGQGLSEVTVNAIAQDRRGFMWFGTADGLNRYDGYGFTVYRHDEGDPASLSGSYVWDLLVDSRGDLWIATSSGLNRFRREADSFERIGMQAARPGADNVFDVLEDSTGALWAATAGGLARFDAERESVEWFRPEPDDPASIGSERVRVLREDGQGRLWVGTQEGLDLLDTTRSRFVRYRHVPSDPSSLSNDFVRAILEDRRGHLWVGTEKGLNRLDLETADHFTRYLHDPDDRHGIGDDRIWAIHEDASGGLWLGTDRAGLVHLDPDRSAFTHYRHDPIDPRSISNNAVYALFEDASGDLWTGNYAGGINLVDRTSSAFSHYRHDPREPRSLRHDSVLAILEDVSGRLWVGTEDGLGLLDEDGSGFEWYGHDPGDPRSLGAPAVLSIHEGRRGGLWVGTYGGGLHRFEGSGGFSHHSFGAENDPGSQSHHVTAICEDRDGRLWVGTFGGLFRRDPGGVAFVRHRLQSVASLAHETIWDVHEDAAGRLWLGSGAGLSLYRSDRGTFVPALGADGAAGDVFSIHDDGAGQLWLGTQGGGLGRFDPEARTVTWYRTEHGLPSGVVFAVLEDGEGHVWLSTNRGLSRFDPRTGTFTSYDQSDGLPGGQFNRNAGLAGREGLLYFGGIEGLVAFDPKEIRANTAVPPVVITELRLFNEPVAPGADGPLERHVSETTAVELRHDQSVVSFEFAALSYRSPGKNLYAYKLEGFDQDWVDAGTRRVATYTNLDPGRYLFRVKASNDSGLWNEQGTSLELTVRPPLWGTWWFRLLAGALAAAALAAAYRRRTRSMSAHNEQLQSINAALSEQIARRRSVEEAREGLLAELRETNAKLAAQNAELERFTYTVSHDLRSPLVTIQGFLGLLRRDTEAGEHEKAAQHAARIGSAAGRMNRLLSELLELSRVGRVANPLERVSLTELAQEAVELLAGPIAERGVSVRVDPEMPAIMADRVRLREVFQNLLENAVRFMATQPQPKVEIASRTQDGLVICSVRDNGIGIDPRYHGKVFELFERLDGRTEGTGVGLALVQRIVEVHGGRVWVESEGPGLGSAFSFSLPMAERAGE